MGTFRPRAHRAADERAPDVAYLGDVGYAVVWQVQIGGFDVYGRAVAGGSLNGSNYLIAGESQNELAARLVADRGGALVVWARDNDINGGLDLYGRQLGLDGDVLGSAFTVLATTAHQDQPDAAGNGAGEFFLT